MLIERRSPRGTSAVALALVPLVVLAGLLAAVAMNTEQSVSRTKRGVDDCAYAGFGIALVMGAAFEVMLLAVIVDAPGADLRAAAGAALFAVGLNLLVVVAPTWSQYQGVAGVAIGYGELDVATLRYTWYRFSSAAPSRWPPLPFRQRSGTTAITRQICPRGVAALR